MKHRGCVGVCPCACDSVVCVRNSCYRAVVQMGRDIRGMWISRCVCIRERQKACECTCVCVSTCVLGLGEWTTVACFSTAPLC